jgi:hypothetical protein
VVAGVMVADADKTPTVSFSKSKHPGLVSPCWFVQYFTNCVWRQAAVGGRDAVTTAHLLPPYLAPIDLSF